MEEVTTTEDTQRKRGREDDTVNVDDDDASTTAVAATSTAAVVATDEDLKCGICLELKNAFGGDWVTFSSKMPNWEKDLVDFSKVTINSKLVACGIDPLKTPAMATAMMEHFSENSSRKNIVNGLFKAIKSATIAKFNDVETLTLTKFKWLTHPEDACASTVYVRDAYKRLWEVVKAAHGRKLVAATVDSSKRGHVLIIGNPGIGKSWCLNYLLYMALAKKLTSLVILRNVEGWYCFHDDKCYEFQQYPGEEWVNSRLKPEERALLLHDIGNAIDKSFLIFESMFYGRVCVVLASSPQEANYANFRNYYKPVEFYCPMLTKEEFVSIHPNHANEFEKYGGCLRDVGDPCRAATLEKNITSFDFGNVSLNLISEGETHRFVQVVPEVSNSESYHLDFVSKHVEELFFQARWKALKENVFKVLYFQLDNPAVRRKLYGIPFKSYVQEYAHKLDFTTVTNIDGSTASIIPANFVPPGPAAFIETAKTDGELESLVADSKTKKVNRWIQPKISNFPVIDAFLVVNSKVYGVQITISDTHQPTTTTLTNLVKHGVSFGSHAKKGIHLDGVIFIVDEYRNPLMQKPQLVPQKKGTIPDQIDSDWGATSNPQYRLLVSCKEWEK